MAFLMAKIINRLKLPGLVRPMRDYDNGELLEVKTTDRYTVISAYGRDYYFIRETGKFDGWGRRQKADETSGDS